MTDRYLKPVRLLTDRYRAEGVDTGAIGVVVEDWGDGSYEVEFSDSATGETKALLTLNEAEVEFGARSAAASAVPAED